MTKPLEKAALRRLHDDLSAMLEEADAAGEHLLAIYLGQALAEVEIRAAETPER